MIETGHIYYPAPSLFKRQASTDLTVAEYVDQFGLAVAGPVLCVSHGLPVLREQWADLPVTNDADLVFIHLPMNGDGGSDPLRVAAMIGLMALAGAVPGMLPAASFFAKGLGAGLLSGVVMAGGSLLLNAVMPVKPPTATQDYSVSASSSTYSLSMPTNTQRIGQVIQVQYGRVMQTPPIIASPWSEYVEGDEFVYVLLSLGWGEYDVEKIMFDNLVFEQFPDVEYHIVGPGQAVPFHDNVFTSPHVTGQEIYRKNNYESGSTLLIIDNDGTPDPFDFWVLVSPNRAVKFAIGDQIFFENAVVNVGEFTIDRIVIEGESGFLHTRQPLQGELIANGTIRQAGDGYCYTDFFPSYFRFPEFVYGYDVFCDIIFPNGLYTVEDDGGIIPCVVELCLVSKRIGPDGTVGDVISELTSAVPTTITGCQKTPLRITLSGKTNPLFLGFGELISVRRTASDLSVKKVDACYWAGLRVNYPPVGSYPGITTLAVRAKASEGLSQDALSKIKVLSTRKLPIWDGETWSAPTATRSIAWAAADACRNPDYSIGMPDTRIDLAALLAMDAIWTPRGDTCDGVFDTKTTFWDGLKTILRAGRAQPHMVGGSVTFTRDQTQTAVKGVFTPRNIVRGSFSIEYVLYNPDTPDDVDVEYLDDTTWAWTTVTCSLPGSSNEAPASVKLWGVTNSVQASHEGLYEAGCNMLRRAFVTFQTELDARVILRGYMVSVSHPLPNWGISGDVLSVSGQILRVSEPVVFGTGNHYISLRRADGTQDGPYIVTPGSDDTHIIMADPVPAHVYTGFDREKTQFQFGPGDSFEKRCLVISAMPKAQGKAELLCVVENDAVHTADGTGGTP